MIPRSLFERRMGLEKPSYQPLCIDMARGERTRNEWKIQTRSHTTSHSSIMRGSDRAKCWQCRDYAIANVDRGGIALKPAEIPSTAATRRARNRRFVVPLSRPTKSIGWLAEEAFAFASVTFAFRTMPSAFAGVSALRLVFSARDAERPCRANEQASISN